MVKLLLFSRVRDISNNLKLYRAEILKHMTIEESGFAADAETGLKAMMARYDIREVPISWINRTVEMGGSGFKTLSAGPGYFRTLLRVLRLAWQCRFDRPSKKVRPQSAGE